MVFSPRRPPARETIGSTPAGPCEKSVIVEGKWEEREVVIWSEQAVCCEGREDTVSSNPAGSYEEIRLILVFEEDGTKGKL